MDIQSSDNYALEATLRNALLPKRKRLFRTLSGDLDLLQVILAILTLLALGGVLTFSYLFYFDDNPPSEINSVHMHAEAGDDAPIVDQVVVGPGDKFYLGLDLCRHTDVVADIHRVWMDGLLYTEPPGNTLPTVLPVGCHHIHREITVPNGLPSGTYTLFTTLSYDVNFLATRNVSYSIGPIIVTED